MMYLFENGLFMYNERLYNIQIIGMDWIKINHIRRKIKNYYEIDIEKVIDEYVVIDGIGIYASKLVKV